MPLVQLSRHFCAFPPPANALKQPNGLLACGGDLSSQRLLLAYQSGIFPWFSRNEPILWWSPDPRAVLFPDQLHISRSLRRFHQRNPYNVTLNTAFEQVINACANRPGGTWITPGIITSYQRLHQLGYAHSLEVWLGDTLAGGLYGVAVGSLFCGESMFSHYSNASKIALLVFCNYFICEGGKLLDCQVLNSHTASLGAREISRPHYLALLESCRHQQTTPHCWLSKTLHTATAKAVNPPIAINHCASR